MKTKLTESKSKCAPGVARKSFSRIACLGAAILICSSASAQNLFVSGNARLKNCRPPCGVIYKFSWDGGQSIFAAGLNTPGDVAFDSAGNLFVVDAGGVNNAGGVIPNAVYKFTQQGTRSTFASVDGVGESFACLALQPIPCCQ